MPARMRAGCTGRAMQLLMAGVAEEHHVGRGDGEVGILAQRDDVVDLERVRGEVPAAALAPAVLPLIEELLFSLHLAVLAAQLLVDRPAPLHAGAGDVEPESEETE